jgi:hypothetical protein
MSDARIDLKTHAFRADTEAEAEEGGVLADSGSESRPFEEGAAPGWDQGGCASGPGSVSRKGVGLRRELVPVALSIGLGLAMSLLPTLTWWPRVGEPVCIVGLDEMFYLAVCSQSYFNHPTYLSDPVFAARKPSLYHQLPLLPGVLVSRALGLGPMGIELAWRFFAGLSIPIAWYLLGRHYLKRSWVVAVLVAILLTDSGLLGSSLLGRQGINTARELSGRDPSFLGEGQLIHPEWRIASPALTMVYLLLHLWLLARARAQPTWLRLVLSGVGFGLLFYVYPYYWTAACAALLLALVLDAGHRRVYFWSGLIGGLIGLPSVVASLMLKWSTPSDWLIRSGKLIHVSYLGGISLPKWAPVVVVLGFLWVWTRRRDLIHLWVLGTSGLILYGSHFLTGVDIENYHWMYVWGPCLSFLLALMVGSALPERGRWSRTAFGCLLAVVVANTTEGLWLRSLEASRNEVTIGVVTDYTRYRGQRLSPGVTPLVPNAVVGGDERFVNQATIFENQRPLDNYWVFLSPSIRDAEWDERKALNVLLSGVDVSVGDAALGPSLRASSWSNDADDEERRIARRIAALRAAERDLDAAIERHGVRYVALKADQVPPRYLGRGWDCLQRGPSWQIWERRPTARKIGLVLDRP